MTQGTPAPGFKAPSESQAGGSKGDQEQSWLRDGSKQGRGRDVGVAKQCQGGGALEDRRDWWMSSMGRGSPGIICISGRGI